MSGGSDILFQSLRAWPDLWRRPALFALVHGAAKADRSPAALLKALFEVEVMDLQEAWIAIVERDDMAAAQAAYERLAPEVSAENLNDVRRRFERRADSVRARSVPLAGPLRAAVARDLDEAVAIVAADPVKAEQSLAHAETRVRESEIQALADLQRLVAANIENDEADMRGARLRLAFETGDLRLARILAGQLGLAGTSALSTSPVDTRIHDPWIGRQSTANLLRWCADPTLAPARWPRGVALSDLDLVLLDLLTQVMETGVELSQVDAEQMLRLVVGSLSDGATRGAIATEPADTASDSWAFNLEGPQAARLFPHAADEGGVAVIVARGPTSQFPSGPRGRRFVAFDVFERWTNSGKPDSIVMTPRMLVRSFVASDAAGDGLSGRDTAFVRLQSATVAVRPLILDVLGRDAARCRKLIGAPQGGALSAADIVLPMAKALDLYVDEGDLWALRYACGDQFPLLLEILQVMAERQESAPIAHRRFDALSALLDPEIEEKVEACLEADLSHRLPEERRTDIALLLSDAAALLETGSAEGGHSVTINQLAEALLGARSVASPEEGAAGINELLSLGLLQKATEADDRPSSILRSLPLPGRLLLRLHDQ